MTLTNDEITIIIVTLIIVMAVIFIATAWLKHKPNDRGTVERSHHHNNVFKRSLYLGGNGGVNEMTEEEKDIIVEMKITLLPELDDKPYDEILEYDIRKNYPDGISVSDAKASPGDAINPNFDTKILPGYINKITFDDKTENNRKAYQSIYKINLRARRVKNGIVIYQKMANDISIKLKEPEKSISVADSIPLFNYLNTLCDELIHTTSTIMSAYASPDDYDFENHNIRTMYDVFFAKIPDIMDACDKVYNYEKNIQNNQFVKNIFQLMYYKYTDASIRYRFDDSFSSLCSFFSKFPKKMFKYTLQIGFIYQIETGKVTLSYDRIFGKWLKLNFREEHLLFIRYMAINLQRFINITENYIYLIHGFCDKWWNIARFYNRTHDSYRRMNGTIDYVIQNTDDRFKEHLEFLSSCVTDPPSRTLENNYIEKFFEKLDKIIF
jgi:hypothetical protein